MFFKLFTVGICLALCFPSVVCAEVHATSPENLTGPGFPPGPGDTTDILGRCPGITLTVTQYNRGGGDGYQN